MNRAITALSNYQIITLLSLPQVDICIITDVQRPGLAADAGIAANQGKIKHNVKKVGKRADNGILDDGGIYDRMISDCGVGANNGILDAAFLADTYRLDKDRVLVLGNELRVGTKLFQQRGIGLQQGLPLSAVKPAVYLEGVELRPLFYHAVKGISNAEFAVGFDALLDIGLQALIKEVGLLELVNAYKVHIRVRDLGLFHKVGDVAFTVDLRHTEVARIINLAHADHGAFIPDHFLYVIITNGISKYDDRFIAVHYVAGEAHGMANALPVVLVNEMSSDGGIICFYVILDLFTQVTHDKNKLVDSGIFQLVNNDAQHGLPGKGDQCFWLGISMRS